MSTHRSLASVRRRLPKYRSDIDAQARKKINHTRATGVIFSQQATAKAYGSATSKNRGAKMTLTNDYTPKRPVSSIMLTPAAPPGFKWVGKGKDAKLKSTTS